MDVITIALLVWCVGAIVRTMTIPTDDPALDDVRLALPMIFLWPLDLATRVTHLLPPGDTGEPR